MGRSIIMRGRSVALVAMMACLFISCTEDHKMGWPPRGTEASLWDQSSKVPGLDIYIVSDSAKRTYGAARTPDSSGYLQGKDAFDAARQRAGDSDATLVAALAMLFLERDVAGHMPWTERRGARSPEQQAIAKPPSISGDTLEYWRAHSQLADLVRCRVKLGSGEVQCKLGGEILRDQAVAEDPMAVVEKDLAADDIYRRMRGIDQLAAMNTPETVKRLQDLALNQRHFKVREAAVKALAKTGGADTVATLSRVLLYDGHAQVRKAAAVALGMLKDPAGRDALERAKKGDADGQVRGEAEHALKQLGQ